MNNEEEKVAKEEVENNTLDNDIIEEVENKEDSIEDTITEEINITEEISEEIAVKEIKDLPVEGTNKRSFVAMLGANIIDQCICVLAAMVVVLVITFVLPFMGYRVANSAMIILIVYIIINILYTTILQSTKTGKTLGGKIFK